jgi:Protein of unknown function (DUF2569)
MAHHATDNPKPTGIPGWLLLYTILLLYLVLHGLGLTIASIIVYHHPSLAGLSTYLPFRDEAIYVATNLVLVLYTVVLIVLILKKRHSAIIHNALLAVLNVVFLMLWHLFGAKSSIGTLVDSLPGLVGIVYFLTSQRVKHTLVL